MNKEEAVQLNKLKRKTGLFFIIVMGVMLICFNFLIQFEVNKEKISASYTAEDTVRKIETQLGRYLENSEMFKNIISSKHTISDEQFNQLARYMKENKTECALKIFETLEDISIPKYIKEAVQW